MRNLILSFSLALSMVGFGAAQASEDICDKIFNAGPMSGAIKVPLADVSGWAKTPFTHKSPSGNLYKGEVKNLDAGLLAGLNQLIAQGAGNKDCEVSVLFNFELSKIFILQHQKDIKKHNGKKKTHVVNKNIETTSRYLRLQISMPTYPTLGNVMADLYLTQTKTSGGKPLFGDAKPPIKTPPLPAEVPAPITLENTLAKLKAHLAPAEVKAIPAGTKPEVLVDLYDSWLMRQDNGKEANYQAFKMDKPTAAFFFYAKWVLKNANPTRVTFQVSPKKAPLDFDAAQYLANYPHVANEATAELMDPAVYAAAHYMHYKDHIKLSYKKN